MCSFGCNKQFGGQTYGLLLIRDSGQRQTCTSVVADIECMKEVKLLGTVIAQKTSVEALQLENVFRQKFRIQSVLEEIWRDYEINNHVLFQRVADEWRF